MSEATPEATTATPAPSEAHVDPEASPSTPPWGDDFDAQTAWDKIQKANREAANLRQRAMSPEQQKRLEEYDRLVEASKSEQQRQTEALEAANRARDEASAEALRYRVAAEHGIGKDDLDLLGSGTEEQITARAQRIAAIRAESTATPAPAAPPPGGQRPVERLRGGATPSAAVSEDDANYARLFGADAP